MDGGKPDVTTQASGASRVGRSAPRILRFVPDADVARDACRSPPAEGFDTVLLHAARARRACGAGGRAGADSRCSTSMSTAPRPVRRTTCSPPCRVPTTDPRHPPATGQHAVATRSPAPQAALALADWWGGRIQALRDAGVAGVRLLGLTNLPADLVPQFLAQLRAACPGAILFGWTPGLPLGRAGADSRRRARPGRLLAALVGRQRRLAVARAGHAARHRRGRGRCRRGRLARTPPLLGADRRWLDDA